MNFTQQEKIIEIEINRRVSLRKGRAENKLIKFYAKILLNCLTVAVSEVLKNFGRAALFYLTCRSIEAKKAASINKTLKTVQDIKSHCRLSFVN